MNLDGQHGRQSVESRFERRIDPNAAVVPNRDEPGADVVSVRMHTRCVYGDVFESTDCGCRNLIRASLERFAREGAGVLVYLHQSGPGIQMLKPDEEDDGGTRRLVPHSRRFMHYATPDGQRGHSRVGLTRGDDEVVHDAGRLVGGVTHGTAEQSAQVEHDPHLLSPSLPSRDDRKPPSRKAPVAQQQVWAILTRPKALAQHTVEVGASAVLGKTLVR